VSGFAPSLPDCAGCGSVAVTGSAFLGPRLRPIGITGVFLDPPYAVEDRSDVYGEESRDVSNQVRGLGHRTR
jgi:hypothetical protein